MADFFTQHNLPCVPNENTNKGIFNYLVGKLSATMDAVLPRASVETEVIKKIRDDIKENGLPRREATRNDNVMIDEKAFVEELWEDSPNTPENKNSKNLTDDSISDNIEMFRKGSTHRRLSENNNFIIDKPTYHKITNLVIKQGADIRIANDEWLQHLKAMNASDVTIGDVIYFREDATVSDVLEETYHFLQNIKGLNNQYNEDLRTILNEINAKEYLLSMTEKYHIPNEEVALTKRQLEYYKDELKNYKWEN